MGADRLIAIAGSVVVHLLLVGILAFTLWESPRPPSVVTSKPIIQARAVDEATAMEPVRRREAEERRKKEDAERKRKAAAEKKRQAEAKQKKLAAEKQRKEEAEKKRLAEVKQKQEAAEKKRLAEVQRKKEEAERKRKEDEDRQRKEEELKRQMAAEAERLAEESERLNALRQAANAQYVDQYQADITNKVQRYWNRPPGITQDYFSCKVEVNQLPGGEVYAVRIIESCGNAVLDRSVEAAVKKASPLPAPPVPEVFDREVVITFVPR